MLFLMIFCHKLQMVNLLLQDEYTGWIKKVSLLCQLMFIIFGTYTL